MHCLLCRDCASSSSPSPTAALWATHQICPSSACSPIVPLPIHSTKWNPNVLCLPYTPSLSLLSLFSQCSICLWQDWAEKAELGGTELYHCVIHKDDCGNTQTWHCAIKALCQPAIPVFPGNLVSGCILWCVGCYLMFWDLWGTVLPQTSQKMFIHSVRGGWMTSENQTRISRYRIRIKQEEKIINHSQTGVRGWK